MSLKKGVLLYEGKAKKVFEVQGKPNLVWLEFKNSLTAFNAQKKGEFENKGQINLKITRIIFEYLKSRGVRTHLVEMVSDHEMVCEKVKVVPLEVVVRNYIAGSLAKKFNKTEGEKLNYPLVEFYFKNDELQDPFVSDEQALVMGIVEEQPILSKLKHKAHRINDNLIEFFQACNLQLVDFKVEFGFNADKELILADEITPDSCRLWDVKTLEKLDKDRFRRDLGQVKESYMEVLNRIEKQWSHLC